MEMVDLERRVIFFFFEIGMILDMVVYIYSFYFW